MNIHIDSHIFNLQQTGGISALWRNLIPALREALPDATFDAALPADVFIPTYYKLAPIGTKSLVMVYDLIAEKCVTLPNRSDRADIRRAVESASAVVSISQQTANDVYALYGRQSTVSYPGVNEDYGKVQPSDIERFRQFMGKPYVLLVGRRGAYKNAQALYQAWRLWGNAANCAVLAVGGEDGLPQDRAFASRFNWQQMRLSDYDLAIAYAGALGLVYPSLMEGFGLPMIEAMACACPVVCDPAMHEVAGEAALYIDMTRPRQIVMALDGLLDPALRLRAGLAGIEQARRYTWSGMAAKVAEALRAL